MNVLSTIRTTTITFHGQNSEHTLRIPCAADTVKSFSKSGHKIHGVVGFKGDLLRILACYARSKKNPVNEVKKWTCPTYLRKLIHNLGGLKQTN
jgi:hypothetical protein